jgi:hypothetical protein
MSRNTIEMHRLTELVRLHRMGAGKREIARLLAISPTTERQYRQALSKAGVLAGAVEELPDLAVLQAAVRDGLPPQTPPQQLSSIAAWAEPIGAMVGRGAEAQAIYDCLRLQEPTFTGSLSAVRGHEPKPAKGVSTDPTSPAPRPAAAPGLPNGPAPPPVPRQNSICAL